MTLFERFQVWRLRPGILFAAKLAEQTAWKHMNASALGPENNLMMFSHGLHMRLLDAQEGKLRGLYLDPVTHLPSGWKVVEAENAE